MSSTASMSPRGSVSSGSSVGPMSSVSSMSSIPIGPETNNNFESLLNQLSQDQRRVYQLPGGFTLNQENVVHKVRLGLDSVSRSSATQFLRSETFARLVNMVDPETRRHVLLLAANLQPTDPPVTLTSPSKNTSQQPSGPPNSSASAPQPGSPESPPLTLASFIIRARARGEGGRTGSESDGARVSEGIRGLLSTPSKSAAARASEASQEPSTSASAAAKATGDMRLLDLLRAHATTRSDKK